MGNGEGDSNRTVGDGGGGSDGTVEDGGVLV